MGQFGLLEQERRTAEEQVTENIAYAIVAENSRGGGVTQRGGERSNVEGGDVYVAYTGVEKSGFSESPH